MDVSLRAIPGKEALGNYKTQAQLEGFFNSKIINPMEYKVVPFLAKIDRSKDNPQLVARQLQILIELHKEKGWTYKSLESVTSLVQPTSGCFGLGAEPGYTTSRQMVVFTKP